MPLMRKEIHKTIEGKVTVLRVTAKCSDCFSGSLVGPEGNTVHEYDGYVPSDLGIGGGDYIEFDLNLETGQIIGYKPPQVIEIEDY